MHYLKQRESNFYDPNHDYEMNYPNHSRGKAGHEYTVDNINNRALEEVNESYENYLELSNKYKSPIGANDLIKVDPISLVAKINPKYQYSSGYGQKRFMHGVNESGYPQLSRNKAGAYYM